MSRRVSSSHDSAALLEQPQDSGQVLLGLCLPVELLLVVAVVGCIAHGIGSLVVGLAVVGLVVVLLRRLLLIVRWSCRLELWSA